MQILLFFPVSQFKKKKKSRISPEATFLEWSLTFFVKLPFLGGIFSSSSFLHLTAKHQFCFQENTSHLAKLNSFFSFFLWWNDSRKILKRGYFLARFFSIKKKTAFYSATKGIWCLIASFSIGQIFPIRFLACCRLRHIFISCCKVEKICRQRPSLTTWLSCLRRPSS